MNLVFVLIRGMKYSYVNGKFRDKMLQHKLENEIKL